MPEIKNTQNILNNAPGILKQTNNKVFNTTDDLQSSNNPLSGLTRGKILKDQEIEILERNQFRKNKRTASVADNQQKRVFHSSINMTNFNKENAYRYMSVTPSHKYHETKKDKFILDSQVSSKAMQVENQKAANNSNMKSNSAEMPEYRINQSIEEVKDEYNESKISFHNTEENEQGSESGSNELDIDLEALILVEDKICALSNNIINEYWDITSGIYKSLNSQLEHISSEAKHISTIKESLLLEFIVVILVTLLADDPKLSKGVQHQFKNLNYYIHQNILILIDLIIEKLPNPK